MAVAVWVDGLGYTVGAIRITIVCETFIKLSCKKRCNPLLIGRQYSLVILSFSSRKIPWRMFFSPQTSSSATLGSYEHLTFCRKQSQNEAWSFWHELNNWGNTLTSFLVITAWRSADWTKRSFLSSQNLWISLIRSLLQRVSPSHAAALSLNFTKPRTNRNCPSSKKELSNVNEKKSSSIFQIELPIEPFVQLNH